MLECCCRKLKKNPKNTNGRLAIPAPAGLLVILRSQCSADSVMSGITWVFFLGWSYRRHQRRPERREELSWIKSGAEQRVKYLPKRLRRFKSRLCIKSAAEQRVMRLQKRLRRSKSCLCIRSAAVSPAVRLQTKSHLLLHKWVHESCFMHSIEFVEKRHQL